MRGATGCSIRLTYLLPLACPSHTSQIPLTYLYYGGVVHAIYTKASATALARDAGADSSVGMFLFIPFFAPGSRRLAKRPDSASMDTAALVAGLEWLADRPPLSVISAGPGSGWGGYPIYCLPSR